VGLSSNGSDPLQFNQAEPASRLGLIQALGRMASQPHFQLSRADLAAVRQLRDVVLRPGTPSGGSTYPGDDAPSTLHIGAFVAGKLVAAATTCQESPPNTSIPLAWRIRGMATLSEYRGFGLAGQLLARCLAYIHENKGTLAWCSSRVATVSFYQRHGFVPVGESFFLPQFSDESYILMEQSLAV
jgi:predicted GNAT family N-acyltransferase